ncbi:MAG: ParB N-terminal domain-containing protein [Oscillospiraceae bacterium]|nr:ParB N-terminal domain-containing protein [Oscillospiraceae bacterium]MBQ3224583.1 ParB N-terminal domain-containing protein [Oscillospiraceae bacterium]
MPDNGLHELLRWSVRNMPERKQDTFSANPQFSNTLYPEISPGYSNGSIPQKNYYTKNKSIYGENTDKALDAISNILTATSLVPGIDTFADAAAIPVDLLRGDYISAGLDAFGILPFVGEVADTAKLARAGMNVADVAHDANKLNITHRLTKSHKEMEKLINDIKSNGIKETIKYVEHNGEKFVVDGHHRLHIARLLGLKNIPVEKVNLPYKGYNSINDLFWE